MSEHSWRLAARSGVEIDRLTKELDGLYAAVRDHLAAISDLYSCALDERADAVSDEHLAEVSKKSRRYWDSISRLRKLVGADGSDE